MFELDFTKVIKKGIKNYKTLFISIIIIVTPIPIITYIQESEKFRSILSSLKENEVAQKTIVSTIDTRIPNVYSIEYEKKLFPLILRRKMSIEEEVNRIVKFVESFSKDENTPPEIKLLSSLPKQIMINLFLRILSETVVIESNVFPEKFSGLSNIVVIFGTNIYYPKYIIFFPVKEIDDIYDAVESILGDLILPTLKNSLAYVLANSILPNAIFDSSLYESEFVKYTNLKNIPLEMEIKKGQEIIKKGKTISNEDLKLLNEYFKNLKSKLIIRVILFELLIVGLSLLSVISLSVFRNIKNTDILTINSSILFLSLYIQLFLKGTLNDGALVASLLPSFIVINNLVSGRKSTLVIGICYILFLFLLVHQSYLLIIHWIVLILVISIMSHRLKKRSDFILIFIVLFILTFGIYVVLHYIEFTDIRELPNMFILSFISTFVNLLVVFLVLPTYEYFFRIATPFILYELSSLDTPLLRELLEKAPGTYYHSLNVSMLSEAASEAIGANSLLAKVGALYHDIGKIENPDYFTENIEGKTKENVNPLKYTEIIKKHPIKGKKMAIKYRLPIEIEKIIYEHHGRSVISYFYNEAKKEGYNVDIEFFRYPTELPTSKESAIVFLCDKIEARIRSLISNHSIELKDIQNEIDNVILSHIISEDLSESELTLKDINRILKALKDTVSYVYHRRIDYPK
ncbi:MAG: HDIG domain-containing metalloprotein [Brevinematia bacterium]